MLHQYPVRLMITGFLLGAGSAHAAVERPFPLVTVGGEASATLAPDLAQATGGVTTEGKTVREASDANAQAMHAMVAALKEAGVAEKDIQTAQFNIAPAYAQPRQGRNDEPRITGYRVSNQVRFSIREIGRVADVLDRAVAAGATDFHGVTFTVADPSKARDQARADAMADARRRAEIYARALGAQVGRAVAIDEGNGAVPSLMQPGMPQRAAAAAAPPPIALGELTLRVSVTVSFELLH
jgi:uncharacterized protein